MRRRQGPVVLSRPVMGRPGRRGRSARRRGRAHEHGQYQEKETERHGSTMLGSGDEGRGRRPNCGQPTGLWTAGTPLPGRPRSRPVNPTAYTFQRGPWLRGSTSRASAPALAAGGIRRSRDDAEMRRGSGCRHRHQGGAAPTPSRDNRHRAGSTPRCARQEEGANQAMAVVTMKQLLDSGVHFGHQTRRWNPKMKRYIFTERNGIYIIDLQQTLSYIDRAYEFIKETVAHGGSILFVGTKKQAQEAIAEQATRVGQPYVNQRWLGGMLTNFQTVSKRIQRLKELEEIHLDDVAGSA